VVDMRNDRKIANKARVNHPGLMAGRRLSVKRTHGSAKRCCLWTKYVG
jgi:hypothetical protein